MQQMHRAWRSRLLLQFLWGHHLQLASLVQLVQQRVQRVQQRGQQRVVQRVQQQLQQRARQGLHQRVQQGLQRVR